MPFAERRAEVTWQGNLVQGNGKVVKVGSGALGDLPITWAARIERPNRKTSPEELIAAAHASCYAMALANVLSKAGHTPELLDISAVCSLERGETSMVIAAIELEVRGKVSDLDQENFEVLAQKAEQSCPVSNALRNNVQIHVQAKLEP